MLPHYRPLRSDLIYDSLPESFILTAEQRRAQIEGKTEQMRVEKRGPLMQFIELQINGQIAKSGEKRFQISFASMAQAIDYRFDDRDFLELVRSIYNPLGYGVNYYGFPKYEGLILGQSLFDNRSCQCQLI